MTGEVFEDVWLELFEGFSCSFRAGIELEPRSRPKPLTAYTYTIGFVCYVRRTVFHGIKRVYTEGITLISG